VIVAGLTGSMGMGKSATTAMFAEEGVPVHDADAAVHALYDVGGAAVAPVEAAFPGVVHDGRVDRAKLGARVVGDPEALARLEAIVHPLVAEAREAFLAHAREKGAALAVVDIPLLFETGAEGAFDAIIVVTAPAEVQRARVLSRPGMTPEKFEALLARQVPDAEKRRRADYLIDTGKGFEPAREQVRRLIALLTQSQA
jgi:dephospho-CoA kinase